MNKYKSKLRFAIGWPLSILAIIFILKFVFQNIGKISINMSTINFPFLLLGVFCFLLYFIMRSVVWGEIIKGYGHKVFFFENLFLWISTEVKRFAPGNIWSFLSRTSQYNEKGISKKTLFTSLLIESECVVVATGLLSIPSVIYSQKDLSMIIHTNTLATIFILIISFLTFIFLLGFKMPFLKKITPPFTLTHNFLILMYSLFTFIIWGLGSSMVSLALFNIPISLPLLISSYSLALLIGYLSILTPMGLGVREGVFIVLISKLMGAVNAATVSLFSRLVLIITELIFLLIISILFKRHDKNH